MRGARRICWSGRMDISKPNRIELIGSISECHCRDDLLGQNARRPSRASTSIWALASSRELPLGNPRANRVIVTPIPAKRFEAKRAVPSPSRVGLVARMISLTPPRRTRSTSGPKVSRSVPFHRAGRAYHRGRGIGHGKTLPAQMIPHPEVFPRRRLIRHRVWSHCTPDTIPCRYG